MVGGFLCHERIDQILEFRIPLNGCGVHLKADIEKQGFVAMFGVEPASSPPPGSRHRFLWREWRFLSISPRVGWTGGAIFRRSWSGR